MTTKRNKSEQIDRHRTETTWKNWVWVGLWYSLILAILLFPLYSGKTEPVWDAHDVSYPAFAYQSDSIAEGRFPLWDPYTNCGLPFHAEPLYTTLNPIAIIAVLFISDSSLALIAYWTFTWWWGGIGMLWLSWYFGARPSGGLIAAMAYILSGFFIGHAQHIMYISIATWLPWIFGFADKAVSTGRREYALLAGSAMGLSSLGGYPGLLAFSGLALTLWLFVRFLPAYSNVDPLHRHFSKRIVAVGGTLIIIAVIAIAIWSPIVHAFFTEGGGYTERTSPLPPEEANYSHPFSLKAMQSIFFPYVTIVGKRWMGTGIEMTNGYVGILTFPLALFWFLKVESKKRQLWILGFFLFFFLAPMGGVAGVRTALYYLYPPMQFMRWSSPLRLFWIFPVCLAAGIGYSTILSEPKYRRYAINLFLGWTALTTFAFFCLIIFLWHYNGIPEGGIPPRLLLPAAAILPAATLCLWLYAYLKKETLSRIAVLFFLVLALADMAGHLYNNQITVWVTSSSIRQTESLHQRSTFISGDPGPRFPPRHNRWFNDQQVTKVPVVHGFVNMRSQGFDKLTESPFVKILESSPRFWLSPGIESQTSSESALTVLTNTGYGMPVPVFIEGLKPSHLPDSRVIPGTYGKTRVLSYAPERIEIEIEVPGQRGGVLASTERYAPGWKAWIDGVPEQVVRTNLFFRGILVPAGRHFVLWTYEPSLWIYLVILSYATLIISIGAALYLLLRGSRTQG